MAEDVKLLLEILPKFSIQRIVVLAQKLLTPFHLLLGPNEVERLGLRIQDHELVIGQENELLALLFFFSHAGKVREAKSLVYPREHYK